MAGGYGLLGDDYSTADILARSGTGPVMSERERRRLMKQQIAGVGLMDEDIRALENDEAARQVKSDAFAKGGLGLMAEATGVPSIMRGAGQVKRGWDESSPMRMAGGAGEMALGAMPLASIAGPTRAMVGAALSNPVRGGMTGAALSTPQALLTVSDARAATPEAELRAKLEKMPPDQLKAFQKMIGANPDGRPGGETLIRAMAYEKQQEDAAKAGQAQAEADRQARLDMEKARIAGGNQLELARIEAEGKARLEASRIKAEAEAALSAKDKARDDSAKLPIRQLWPEFSAAVPVISAVAAGATGGKIRGAAVGRYNAELESLLPRWKAAVDAKDPILAKSFETSVNALRAKGPGGFAPAAGAGAAEGAIIGLLPEEIDIGRGVPGAMERALSHETLVRGATTGLMGGLASTMAGVGARSRGMKKEPVGDYGPETQALTGVNQRGISEADAYQAYQAGLQRNKGLIDDAATETAVGAERNIGRVANAKADAETQLGLLSAARQSAADAQRLGGRGLLDEAGASAPSAMPSARPASAQSPPRPEPQPALDSAPPQKTLPVLDKQPREWSRVWSDPARKSVEEFITANPNTPLTALEAPKLLAMIEAKLPAGVNKPSVTTVRNYLKELRGHVPDEPTLGHIRRQWQKDPGGLLFSGAGPAIAAGGLGLMGGWQGDGR